MAYVLDTSAIVNDPSFYFGTGNFLICPSVLSEIREERSRTLVDNAIEHGLLELREPSEPFVKKVKNKADSLGENLSKADVDSLALALETGEELVTDDYGMQNTAEFLGIKYTGAFFKGIRKKLKWVMRCSGCGRRQDKGKVCSTCGGKLVRKSLG